MQRHLFLTMMPDSRDSLAYIRRMADEHGDGRMTYPRNIEQQAQVISDYQRQVIATGSSSKPVMQPLYVDLAEDPNAPPQPIHLGFRSGVRALRTCLKSLEAIGVNHVALNLRFNHLAIETTLQHLADELLPEFS